MIAFPYSVEFGRSLCERVSFATFEQALLFYQGYVACGKTRHRMRKGFDDGPRLINTDKLDGAPDGNPTGLTADEREQMSNAT
jgi:hypothetical protein